MDKDLVASDKGWKKETIIESFANCSDAELVIME